MSDQRLPRGFAPNAPIQSSAAQINVPVSVGGQIVHPGDIILGDENGVVVISRDLARTSSPDRARS